MYISGICSVDIAQSWAVNPSLQMHEPLTHFPLKVQSFGHSRSTISDTREELLGSSPLLSFTCENRFLPATSPHSLISTEATEIAKEVSPVSYKISQQTFLWLEIHM